MNTSVKQKCIKLIKSESENTYNVKNFILNKCCSFELFIYQRTLEKCSTKILSHTTVYIIDYEKKCF